MNHSALFSRRPDAAVDFRPDLAEGSPSAQMRRLSAYLISNHAKPEDITDCADALSYLKEYTYRKIFTGTTHAEYLELEASDPAAIEWLIAVHEAESSAFQTRKIR